MTLGFSTRTRGVIETRDGEQCFSCGGRGSELHHRRPRRPDGDGLAHLPANGIRLCGRGNTSGCHGRVHKNRTWALAKGYVVERGKDPAEARVWHFSRGWITLDNEGGWKAAEDGDDDD